MKVSHKTTTAIGIVLLALAAFFSLSLIVHTLDFGYETPAHGTFLFTVGDMLVSVYGFCSMLIPAFLLCAAFCCFTEHWNLHKAARLVTAIVPFFTAVITEDICRSILSAADSQFTTIKLILGLIISGLLIAVEITGAGLVADQIFKVHAAPKPQKQPKQPKSKKAEKEFTEADAFEPVSIIEAAGPDLKEKTMHAETEQADKTAEAYTAQPRVTAEAEPVEPAETAETAENPTSVITEEEYSALTAPDLQESEQTDTTAVPQSDDIEELTWPEIKPQPVADADLDEPADLIPDDDFDREQRRADEAVKAAMAAATAAKAIAQDKQVAEPATSAAPAPIPASPADASAGFTQSDIDSYAAELDAAYSRSQQTVATDNSPAAGTDTTAPQNAETSSDDSEAVDLTADKGELSLDPEFFDIDMNAETPDEQVQGEKKTATSIGAARDVFAEMDDDIRKSIEAQSAASGNVTDIPAVPTTAAEKTEDAIPAAVPAVPAPAQEQETTGDTVPDAQQTPLPVISENADVQQTADSSVPGTPAEPATEAVPEPTAAAGPTPKAVDRTEPPAPTTQIKTPAVQMKKEEKKPKLKGKYKIPTTLLTEYQDDQYWIIDDETKNASVQLKETLNEFNIEADIIGIKKGPVVTMFEILPAPGVKLSKIAALQDNIALRLAASSVRIVAPIPGKRAVGIEIPNKNRSIVSFREIIEMDLPEFSKMAVPVILGKDILGKPQLLDLVKTPHMLIAGATGSGKSVCVNSMILSILYKRSPNEVKLILIDPKIVELKLYNDIPHLLTPVITEPKKAFQALQYCLCEMERRYSLLDGLGVRDISNYNKRIEERNIATEKLPYIVVIIDEFADLMATSGKELESTVARLAAMSRAVGIHLVLATQRPSIDVITGLIKANIPSRIAFMVASKMDSRIIIDQVGAEKLLGRGDMLYASAVDPFPVRIQGTFVSDSEVESVVEYVKQYGEPEYIDDEIFVEDDEEGDGEPSLFDEGEDPLYNQALDIVVQAGKASASYIQRRLKIGYNRAARLVEEMEDRGIVGPANGSKPREIIHVP